MRCRSASITAPITAPSTASIAASIAVAMLGLLAALTLPGAAYALPSPAEPRAGSGSPDIVATTAAEGGDAGMSASGPSWTRLALVALVAGVVIPTVGFGGLALATRTRCRRDHDRAAAADDRRVRERADQANGRLVAGDEALREATLELGFAEARFAPRDLAPFASAISAASRELTAAFAIHRQLDAGTTTVEQRRLLLERLEDHAQRSGRRLTTGYAHLRELAQDPTPARGDAAGVVPRQRGGTPWHAPSWDGSDNCSAPTSTP